MKIWNVICGVTSTLFVASILTFGLTDFATDFNPTNGIFIDDGTTNANTNIVNVTSLGSNFAGGVTFIGDANDQFNVLGSDTVTSANVTAGTFSVAAVSSAPS